LDNVGRTVGLQFDDDYGFRTKGIGVMQVVLIELGKTPLINLLKSSASHSETVQ